MIDSSASKICVDISNSIFIGDNNISGFVGKVIDSEINNTLLKVYLDIKAKSNTGCFWNIKKF